jgi:hypothetical protein
MGKSIEQLNIGEIKVQLSHEGYFHFRDMRYIIRAIRKTAVNLTLHISDIDLLQLGIESFLLLNSRIYDDLIKSLIKEVKVWHVLPDGIYGDVVTAAHKESLSYKYHGGAKLYRHRAAHGSNFLRVGIPEFSNDVLPRPINYTPTISPVLENMVSVNNLVRMWQLDMMAVASELEILLARLVTELNKYKDKKLQLPKIYDTQVTEWMSEIRKIIVEYENISFSGMSENDIYEVMREYKNKTLVWDRKISEAMMKIRPE